MIRGFFAARFWLFLSLFLLLALAPSQSLAPKETPATALQGSVPRPGKAHRGKISQVEFITCEGTTAVLNVPGNAETILALGQTLVEWQLVRYYLRLFFP